MKRFKLMASAAVAVVATAAIFTVAAPAQASSDYSHAQYQVTFSLNCNGSAVSPPACAQIFGLGGFWGWIALAPAGTGNAQVTDCGHTGPGGGRGSAGAGHIAYDPTWMVISSPVPPSPVTPVDPNGEYIVFTDATSGAGYRRVQPPPATTASAPMGAKRSGDDCALAEHARRPSKPSQRGRSPHPAPQHVRGHSGTLAQASYLSPVLRFSRPERRISTISARASGSVIFTGTPCSAHDRSTHAMARLVISRCTAVVAMRSRRWRAALPVGTITARCRTPGGVPPAPNPLIEDRVALRIATPRRRQRDPCGVLVPARLTPPLIADKILGREVVTVVLV